MRYVQIFILIMVLSVSAQPDPVVYAQKGLERMQDSIKAYPDVTRFKEEKLRLQTYLDVHEKRRAKNHKATFYYVNHLLENDSTDVDFTKEELYVLRGDFRLFEHTDYQGAIEDYIQILSEKPHSRKLVDEKILQVLNHKKGLAFNSQQLTITEKAAITKKTPLEASVFRQFVHYKSAVEGTTQQLKEFSKGYILGQRVVFFQRVYELVDFYISDGEFKKAHKVLNSLSAYTPRDPVTNTYNFENYSEVHQMLARVHTTSELENDELFLEQLYLFVGSPIGQTQEIDSDLWNHFKALQNKNELWYFINTIVHLRKAYYASYDGLSKEDKTAAIKIARASLEKSKGFPTSTDFHYLHYYLKAILHYEFDGNVRRAFESINNALARNKRDFFVFEYRQRMLRLYNNRPSFSGMTDQELKEEMKSNSLSQQEYSSQIKEKPLTLELVFDIIDMNKQL
jgi:tetratricopeptide (TPR) repeat protein